MTQSITAAAAMRRPHTLSASTDGLEVHKLLLDWYRANGRKGLPWRETRDPYKVLVSELMLQQTQVPRVIPKYNAFLKLFPSIRDLARANRVDVLRAWQGLGYNSRAVRLHALAKMIVEEHDGTLPSDYEGLRRLPGIGPYTAGAVMSFAYNLPASCVDVNIQRVLARIAWSPRKRADPDAISTLALRLVQESGAPHDWHSALMDFGSTVCTAKNPACATCPLRKVCKSRGQRNDETDASKRQPKFMGSVRWWRGQVLKILLKKRAVTMQELQAINSTASKSDADGENDAQKRQLLETALVAMECEGIIIRDMSKKNAVRLR